MKNILIAGISALGLSGCVVASDDLYPNTFDDPNPYQPSITYYIYDDCDIWPEADKLRFGNFIITRNMRSEAQHIEGLNYFRNKYGVGSFNNCYDHLITGGL
jgi:hypothetical protein